MTARRRPRRRLTRLELPARTSRRGDASSGSSPPSCMRGASASDPCSTIGETRGGDANAGAEFQSGAATATPTTTTTKRSRPARSTGLAPASAARPASARARRLSLGPRFLTSTAATCGTSSSCPSSSSGSPSSRRKASRRACCRRESRSSWSTRRRFAQRCWSARRRCCPRRSALLPNERPPCTGTSASSRETRAAHQPTAKRAGLSNVHPCLMELLCRRRTRNKQRGGLSTKC
mmetsp:Transcript_36796/g.105966  ORF Transcript_36796/g.105966 Transcript_36796/m.105966 type:complete len:235 (-) Transcript_36796:803-1507(-)